MNTFLVQAPKVKSFSVINTKDLPLLIFVLGSEHHTATVVREHGLALVE